MSYISMFNGSPFNYFLSWQMAIWDQRSWKEIGIPSQAGPLFYKYKSLEFRIKYEMSVFPIG